MKTLRLPFLLLTLCLPALVQGQTPAGGGTNNNSNNPAVIDGWRGYLSIDYKGGQFVIPYNRIVSVTRHQYMIDGGGKVDEVTVDTSGTVIARYYFLESPLESNPTNAGQIINNRLNQTKNLLENRTGVDADMVIKHYPDTTHAKTVEFRVSDRAHLGSIFQHVTHEWIEMGGRGQGQTLKF